MRREASSTEKASEALSAAAPASAPALHPFEHPAHHHDVPEELRQVPRRENSGWPSFVSRDEM